MQHLFALTSSPTAGPSPDRTMNTVATQGVLHPPFTAPEWTLDVDTIMARWRLARPGAHGNASTATLVTTPFGSFLTTKDVAAGIPHRAPEFREDPMGLQIAPQHTDVVGATLQARADTALADVRHAVISGDPDVLAFFTPDASLPTPTTAVAAFYICDAVQEKARTLQQAAATATGPRRAALCDAAVLLRAQAAKAHVPQSLGEVEHEIRARIVAVASTLYLQAVQATDQETATAYVAAAEMILQATAPERSPAESAIAAARTFNDAMQRAGLDEVASDAAVSSDGVQAGLIHALDNARDTIAETFTELAQALGRDRDTSGLDEAATKLNSAAEDVTGLLDDIDPDRSTVVEI